MAFTETERQQLMELKFVGAKIIERLEEMNFNSFDKLRNAS
ncbi:hypothetical protein [Gilliamella sp. Bif1-4]|jgi:hypothetical protein|nr:hypothetical protein [Gilliamella apicola]